MEAKAAKQLQSRADYSVSRQMQQRHKRFWDRNHVQLVGRKEAQYAKAFARSFLKVVLKQRFERDCV